jgi:hypothetical protein
MCSIYFIPTAKSADVSDKFRSPKRKILTVSSKRELQQELEKLREHYGSPSQNNICTSSTPADQTNVPTSDHSRIPHSGGPLNTTSLLNSISSSEDISPRMDQSFPGSNNAQIIPLVSPVDAANWASPQNQSGSGTSPSFLSSIGTTSVQPTVAHPFASQTTPRRLGDVELGARKIDGCFTMFVSHYSAVTKYSNESKVFRELCFLSSRNF